MCNRDTFTYSVGALRHSLPGAGNSDAGVAWGTEKSGALLNRVLRDKWDLVGRHTGQEGWVSWPEELPL